MRLLILGSAVLVALAAPVTRLEATDAPIVIHITGPGKTAKYILEGSADQQPVHVAVGRTVRWANDANTNRTHTATSTAQDSTGTRLFDTHDILVGAYKEVQITPAIYQAAGGTPGGSVTVTYFCGIHGASNMQSSLVLDDAPSRRSTATLNALTSRVAIIQRKDARDLSADEIDKYKEAVRRLRARGNERPTWTTAGIVPPDASTVDRTGYSYQALIHTNQCPHRNWWFLPWHRVYLYYYETMLRDAVADYRPGVPLAIPYWDWTTQRTLPDMFASGEPGNPLYDPRRFSTPITEEDVGQATIDRVVNQAATFSLFGSGSVCTKLAQGIECPFESGPHDMVHGDVGGGNDRQPATFGTMSSTLTSAFDPVFWSHHANIDRLWDVWMSQPGHTNPDYDEQCPEGTRTWGNLVFDEFVDPRGQPIRRTVKEFLESPEIRSVRYLPRSAPSGPSPPVAMADGSSAHPQKATMSLEIGKPVTLTVPSTSESRATLSTPVTAQDATSKSITFVVEGVTSSSSVGDMRVRAFLNNTAATASTSIDDSSYIGYFTFFLASHSGATDAAPTPTDYALNLSPAIKKLGSRFTAEQPLQITLVLVPKTPVSTAAAERQHVTIEGGHLSIDK